MSTVMRIVLFIIFIGYTTSMHGQSASVAIDKDRKAWLGLNVGGFWQGSDIRPAAGAGSGLTFDYHFIRNHTSVFGIGVRAQYLKATSLGLGITRDYTIQNNPSLNGVSGNPDYASLGGGKDYVFQNYSTDVSDISGNVIISLNRLRAVSRINLYVFGGIGGTGYIASMNQRDASGNLYDYDLISSNGTNIKNELKDLRDDTYETYGEGGATRSWAFTPTVGAGFGIQLSSRVQLAIEHKVGFTGTDLLDGNKYGTSNSRNDIYHYASFGVNFGIGKLIGGSPATTQVAPRRTSVVPSTPAEPTTNLPAIRITSPASATTTLENCSASIKAIVENVNEKEGITVLQDRIPIAFEFSGQTLTVSDVNFSGATHFVITAKNSAGTVNETVSFVCQPKVEMITICHQAPGNNYQTIEIPATEWATHQSHGDSQGECPPAESPKEQTPVITIHSPTTSTVTLENCSASIRATVENISSKLGIAVMRDRTPIVFEFTGNTLTVSNVNFTGTANFVIVAKNSAGQATKTISFVCQPPVQMITICHRAQGQSDRAIDIPIHEWPSHQAHGDTQGPCPVIERLQVRPPVVRITSPATSPVTVDNCKAVVTATVENITDQQSITVTQNDNPVAFEFAANTVTITNVDITGTAHFVIKATNSAGTATQTVSFVCQPKQMTICHVSPGNSPQTITIAESAWPAHEAHGDAQGGCPVVVAPVVRITSPATSPVTVDNCKAAVTATVENITDQQSITVTQNDNPIAFEFAANTVTVTNVDITGTAHFVIKATNSAGTATQTVSFVCQSKQMTICHVSPGNSPQTITIAESAWPAHEAHGDAQGGCPVVVAPVVRITSPATSPVTVDNCKAAVTATVENITDQQSITVTQNDNPIAFEFAANTVTVTNVDITGTAHFVIKATNSAGTATQTVSFVCQSKQMTICHVSPGNSPQTITIAESAWPAHEAHGDTQGGCPVVVAPVVRITSPATSPVTVDNCKAAVTATVENITDQQSITVTQNDNPIAFEFAANTVTVTNVDVTGTAHFVIKATNSAGTATQTVSFVCQPKQMTICHVSPGNSPQTITIAESAWPAHEAHGDAQGGCPVVVAPVVRITSPATSPVTVDNCKAAVTATVENITDQQSITVTQNDNPVAFEFAANTVTVTNVDITGTAYFVIKATNSAGTATQTVSFVCQPKKITICHIPPGNKDNPQTITIAESAWPAHEAHGDTQGGCPVVVAPVVRITSPATSPVTVDNCKAAVTATVENITDKQSITVTQNDNPIAFEFAANTVTVTNVDITGTAHFVIKATNSAGTATQTVSFVCELPKDENPEKEEVEESKDKDSDKITICHKPPGNRENSQTLTISKSAWPAHEKHGDTMGPCKD